MSEQSDALNRTLRDRGLDIPVPPQPPADESGQALMPGVAAVPLELPREGRSVSRFAREAGAIAKQNGIFRKEVEIVTIDQETGQMRAMTPNRFCTYMESIAFVHKKKRRPDASPDDPNPYKDVEMTMKPDVAKNTLQSDDFMLPQRKLHRINMVRQPVKRNDGRIELLQEGYDDESQTFTMKNSGIAIEDGEKTWSLEKSRRFLLDMHAEFPFEHKREDGTSRGLAIHIAGLLSLYAMGLQPLIAARMNFIYEANQSGSGKGLLVKIPTIAVTGRCKSNVMSDNAAEFRKTLDMVAMGGAPYLFLDEMEGNIRNRELNSFTTSDVWSGRILGGQAEFEAPKLTICFFTGNNLTLTPDINRRSLMVKLYVQEADGQERRVANPMESRDLMQPAVRADILSALWGLICAWDKAGRPGPKTPHTRNGFEEWVKIYGGIVDHAGFGNPLEPPPAEESPDCEFADMLALVKLISEGLGMPNETGQVEHFREYAFEELIEAALSLNAFTWIIDGKWKVEKIEGREDPGSKRYEATAKCNGILGKIFSGKFGGQTFNLGGGRRVLFGHRGRNRQKKYGVKLL